MLNHYHDPNGGPAQLLSTADLDARIELEIERASLEDLRAFARRAIDKARKRKETPICVLNGGYATEIQVWEIVDDHAGWGPAAVVSASPSVSFYASSPYGPGRLLVPLDSLYLAATHISPEEHALRLLAEEVEG